MKLPTEVRRRASAGRGRTLAKVGHGSRPQVRLRNGSFRGPLAKIGPSTSPQNSQDLASLALLEVRRRAVELQARSWARRNGRGQRRGACSGLLRPRRRAGGLQRQTSFSEHLCVRRLV